MTFVTDTLPEPAGDKGNGMIICSEIMRKLLVMVERVARSNASVLITGETGTGKELIARAIHQHSLRCTKSWVDLNCGALPEHLVESELFGYEKGAFSGAHNTKTGLFELANHGTLFLDEIGELPAAIQVKLLRVLDGIPYYRLGGTKKVAVDVRIIAATNRPLEEAVRTGAFRSDLYHRLAQFQITVPPLRDRPEDVVGLAQHYLAQHRPNGEFAPDALALLKTHPWPGNIRELRNTIIQTALVGERDVICANDLPPELHGMAVVTDGEEATDLGDLEKQTILSVLQRTGGHQGLAAQQLGISRRTLSRKLKQYNTNVERRRSATLPLGVIASEQQHCFRAALETGVTIRTGSGREFRADTVNVSSGGICVQGIENPFECSGVLSISFPLGGSSSVIHVKATMAWADVHGNAGLRFTEVSGAMQHELDRWLAERQQDEGWGAPEPACATTN
jgi:transcriptional regulator with GAF, ATPase, and Fis domain